MGFYFAPPWGEAAMSRRVRAAMKRRGLSYRELAEESGLTVATAHRLVNRKSSPPVAHVLALLCWLEIEEAEEARKEKGRPEA